MLLTPHTWGNGHRVGDEPADNRHYHHGEDKNTVGCAFNSMPPPETTRSQGGVGKQAGSKKQERVAGEKVVGQGISLTKGNDDAD